MVVGLPDPDVGDAGGVELRVVEARPDAVVLALTTGMTLVLIASTRSCGVMASHSGVVLMSMKAVTTGAVSCADMTVPPEWGQGEDGRGHHG